MTEIPPEVEETIASMSEGEFTAFIAKVRAPEESQDPMERASAALRSLRGVDRRGTATKEDARRALTLLLGTIMSNGTHQLCV